MLSPGTIIGVAYGPIEHVALITDEGTVIHSSKENGVVAEEPVHAFIHGRQVRALGSIDWGRLQTAKWRGRAKLGERWTPLNNCEHFISEICGSERQSPQLKKWLLSAFIVLGGLYLARKGA